MFLTGPSGSATAASWLVRPRDTAPKRPVLICLPYAGGSTTAFRSWDAALAEGIELWGVQLPGRGTRVAEPPYTRLRPLVGALAQALQPATDRPYALFGHSMGALLAYEVAVALRADGRPQPRRLIVSGHRAPHLPAPRTPIHQLDDRAFLEEVGQLDGLPTEVLADAELRELILPALRADFEVCETYEPHPEPPLDADILAVGGVDDELVPETDLAAWAAYTRGEFALERFAGGHFFLETERAAVLARVAQAVATLSTSLPRAG